MTLNRVAVCVFATCLVLGEFALGQVQPTANLATNDDRQLSPPSATATVPRLIRMQGTLRDEGGTPLTGRLGVTFSLYRDQRDGEALWQESQTVVLDANGQFTAFLGASNEAGLPLEIFSAGEARWLSVRPDGHAEQPRILLLSVAYALKAADAETLGGRPASAYVLAENLNSATAANLTSAAAQKAAQIPSVTLGSTSLMVQPAAACSSVTSDGTATANKLAKFTAACNIGVSAIFESAGNVGIGTTTPAGVLDVAGTVFTRGLLTAQAGVIVNPQGTATTSQGFNSSPMYIEASVYNTTLNRAVSYLYNWQAEPTGNNSSATNATLNLTYGAVGSVLETGLSINRNGLITFAPGQTFPGGSGTVTSVGTGPGLTGGPITTTGTINIAAAGITNAMLANPSLTVTAGSGLSGGGSAALGGSTTLSLNTTFTDTRYLSLAGGTLTGALAGTTGTFSGALSSAGSLLPQTGTATAAKGFVSNALDLRASSFSSSSSSAVAENFRWQAEPTGNNTASPSGSLNLLFGANGAAPAETGLSIASNGRITFAAGQTFPGSGGSGTVTSVGTGAGLTGGPITSSGTISIPAAGVTNAMLANNSITVTPGTGLSGGGTVALGGTVTLNSTAAGTVTNVATGAGLTGGPITSTGTINIAAAGITNAMLQHPSITVTAGSGLSGGGTVALGGTITLTNTASGGTVTSVASGTGLTGGPITTTGTLNLDTNFTDARYLQLSGGILTGSLTGTSAAFAGSLAASSGTFTGPVSANSAVIPATGAATSSQGFNSGSLDLRASSFNSTTSSPVVQDFQWLAEPSGNNSSSPSGSLNLLFGANGVTPSETGLSIASTGVITFASSQTFPGGGGGGTGTVTSVNTGPGLTGGPITSSGTISIAAGGVLNNMLANPFITVNAGSGLTGGGTVALGGSVTLASNLSGTQNGLAYFSSPASITSTPAPSNGQVLIGSTGNAPTLATLTAGSNVTITNGPGSITISATGGGGGGAPTLPMFVTGSQRNGNNQPATKNINKLWGFILPYNVTTTKLTYNVTTVDTTSNAYDIGIYDSTGHLMVSLGATAGSTFAPAKNWRTLNWKQGATTLQAGKYYIGFTTNCSSTCAGVAAVGTFVSFAVNTSAGASTGGALASTVAPPIDTWASGNQPTLVIQ